MLNYPENEQLLLQKIQKLQNRWKTNISDKELFVEDGFYPYYLNQKIKILFIGREALDIEQCNYIEVLQEYYSKHYIHDTHINRHNFHRRLMKISYGILNNMPDWCDIPTAAEICNTFATKNGVSFAFMNASKSSNATDSIRLSKYYRKSIEESAHFIKEEVELLQPDVIITANIQEMVIKQIFKNVEIINKEV